MLFVVYILIIHANIVLVSIGCSGWRSLLLRKPIMSLVVGSMTSNFSLLTGSSLQYDPNFTGNCAYVTGFGSGQCVNVGSDFNDQVTGKRPAHLHDIKLPTLIHPPALLAAFGPDSGLTCSIYK